MLHFPKKKKKYPLPDYIMYLHLHMYATYAVYQIYKFTLRKKI